MVQEIHAKTLLTTNKAPDPWFGLKYNLNLCRGCPHQCIYCDSRSECYRIEDFREILVKVNAVELLRDELRRKRIIGTIGTGSMNDPYSPIERQYGLMRRTLEVIALYGFPVHIVTKGDLVVRDIDLLQHIGQTYAAVSMTITTTDDDLARKLEPGAPSPSARLQAVEQLAKAGIYVGITMMPVLPFITDSEENTHQIIKAASESGASYIIPWFGVTLRDRQRSYYYDRLDSAFPGLSPQYRQLFGNSYFCPTDNAKELESRVVEWCQIHRLTVGMRHFMPRERGEQLPLQP